MPRPLPLLDLLAGALPAGQALLLAALPHGGQRTARRNAWSAMAGDASRARARREAQAAVEAAHRAVLPPPLEQRAAAGDR